MTSSSERHSAPIRNLALGMAFLVLVLPASAQAQVMTFDANACTGGGATSGPGPWVEAGYSLSFAGIRGYGAWCTDDLSYAGSPAIFQNGPGQLIELTQVGGGAFAIHSIDLATVYFQGSAGSAFFTGFLNGGGTVNTTFNFAGAAGSPSFETFYFGAGWEDLLSVQWTQGTPYHQFDNVTLGDPSATVPEPATITLLATGLAGMAAGRRRKRRG